MQFAQLMSFVLSCILCGISSNSFLWKNTMFSLLEKVTNPIPETVYNTSLKAIRSQFVILVCHFNLQLDRIVMADITGFRPRSCIIHTQHTMLVCIQLSHLRHIKTAIRLIFVGKTQLVYH